MKSLNKFGVVPIAVVLALILFLLFLNFESPVFDPPYLLLTLNLIFITGTNLVVALICARSYLKYGLLNVLLLGSGLLISGLSSAIAGFMVSFSANYGVTVFNMGAFGFAFLQLLSSVVTGENLNYAKEKRNLSIVYFSSLAFVTLLSISTLLDLMPVFFTSAGGTAIRASLIGASMGFLAVTSIIFRWRFRKSNSTGLYWYSLAMGMFAVGLLGISVQTTIGDAFNWLGRIGQYTACIYFIIALLNINRQQKGSISDKWAEAFSTDRKQAANFFARMFNAYAYAKVVTDEHGKPIDWIFLDTNDSFERITGIKRDTIAGKNLMSVFPQQSKNRYNWIEKLGNVALTEKHENFESYFEGFEKWLNVSAYSPRKGYFVAIFEDVTERKKFEENVKETKEKYQAIIETIGDFIWEIDVQGRYVYCSPQMEKIWKINPKEMIGKTPFDQMPPETREEGMNFFRSFVASQQPFSGIQVPSLDGQGNLISIEISGVPFFNDKGEILGFRGTTRDVTERKKAEKKIADLAKFPMENPGAVLRVDNNGTILFANPKATDFVKEWQTNVGGKVPERINSKIVDALSSGDKAEFEENLGEQIYSFMVTPIAGEGYANLYGRSITLRKKAEETLKQSEERFRSVLNNSLDVIYRYNLQTDQYEYMSPAIRQLGFEPEEMTSMTNDEVLLHVHPDDLPALKTELARLAETGKGFSEYRFLDKDGDYRWLSNQMTVTNDQNGKPLYRDGHIRDITERKKADENLRANEVWKATSFYTRNLIEASLDPLVTISVEGKITDVNKATELATGCSRVELIGSDFSSYFTEPEKAAAGYKQVFTKGFVKDYPLAIRHKSGDVTDVLYNASVYRNERGEIQGVFAAARDITKRKKAEAALRRYQEQLEHLVAARTKQASENEAAALEAQEVAQSRAQELEKTQAQLEEKAAELETYATHMEELAQDRLRKLKDSERLAAIGATAGMVGHDIRNPLQAIIGDIYLAVSDVALLPPGELKASLQESLDSIQKSVEYVNKIVQDLQDYARPIKPVFEETPLQNIIEDAVKKNNIPENIKFKQNLAKEAQTIRTDADLLKRILGNLVSNATQAMPKGGDLALRVRIKGEYTVITVRDTGVGISPEAREKLFTPLFTTKSKGQGFGLSVVKRMTEALGGTITFESKVGKGTKFIVWLPQKPMQ